MTSRRLRWWICLNPRFESKRGVPHARMRTTTYRLLPLTADADANADAAWRVVRRVEEQELRFDKERVGEWEGRAALDADFMAGFDWLGMDWVYSVLARKGCDVKVINRIKNL